MRFAITAVAALLCPWAAASDPAELVAVELESRLERIVRSALPDEAAPETRFEARRQSRRAAEAVRAALNAEGYFDPSIEAGVVDGDPPRALVRVSSGPRFSIGVVRASFSDETPGQGVQASIQSEIGLTAGDPAEPAEVIAAETRIVEALQRAGRPDARVVSRDVVGDRDAAVIDVSYKIEAGPQAVFGDMIVGGESVVRRSYLEKLSPIQVGGVFDPDAMSEFRKRLADTRLFKSALVRLDDPRADPREDETRNVIVTLDERPRNVLSLGGFFATDNGVGAEGRYTRRNFTRRGDDFSVLVRGAQRERAVSFEWRLPNQPRFNRTLIFETGFENEDNDAFNQSQVFSAGAVEAKFKGGVTGNLGAR
ncbi:MAG: POTRA domain-containing protein, partial [Pseudomonadota bacterium]